MQDIKTIRGCDFVAHYYATMAKDIRSAGRMARTMRGYTQTLKERYPGIRAPLNLYVLHWLDTYGTMSLAELDSLFSGVVQRSALHTCLSSLRTVGRVQRKDGEIMLYSSLIQH